MAYGELFRHFTIRFSLKKGQHVKLLQWFEDKKLNEGRTKNQIVMDGLELYYEALFAKNGGVQKEEITLTYLEKRLSDMRAEIKEEIRAEIKAELLQEILGAVLGGSMAGQQVMASVPAGEPETADRNEDEAADISGMPDVMDKIMGWSED